MALGSSNRELGGNIGKTIAKYRMAAGLTQAQVAEILDVSNDAVSRMERGGIMPTVARLIKLAEIFGCEVTDLLTESSPLVNDQSKRLAALLGRLDEEARMELMDIVEQMVKLYERGIRRSDR
ncbi:helix-turn-helix domain-containing protein [Neisseria animalis]|uniref:XRE family transcriptional regulator n=1 Tax=Neisseria animalis TaxID=492 RepID=A0A5P3MSM1_NEIAN|nr:helix-turn-helix transcriptional regulator [Neisseria animalis]QEY24602.1 XRE family transcriptional regulator [Neisseria animalis]ROW32985.1 XRE family transcriptional regulator [Neisseria animalis]VEE07457.1 DNA-binding protein [Neisseria animalis]